MSVSVSVPQAYTIASFQAAFGIGKTTVFAEIAAGRLEARKAGGRTLIPAEAAARWLASLPKVGGQA